MFPSQPSTLVLLLRRQLVSVTFFRACSSSAVTAASAPSYTSSSPSASSQPQHHSQAQFSSFSSSGATSAPEEVRVLDVKRVTKVTKGGRILSFGALVVSGNRNGLCGWGYGKSKDVPSAVSKAIEQSKKNRVFVEDLQTISHPVTAKVCRTVVELRPAHPESGVRANRNIAAIAQVAGIKDLSAKVHGSTCKMNVIRATLEALDDLRTGQEVASRRGVVGVPLH